MSDTGKQKLMDFCEILVIKKWFIKSFAFKIFKLTSLEYFQLPNRSVLVIVASA